MELVHFRIEDRIAIVTVENPPVNALSAKVQESLRDAIGRAVQDSDVDAAVIVGAGNTFIAGADIRQLERMARDGAVQSILPQTLIEIEAAPKPFVAAIHGNAFGGGLEVALAAHYRIATAGSRIGQPEVKLGIIPGAGGTQRLPRLAGVEAALEMCVFGEPVRAEDAKRSGYYRPNRRSRPPRVCDTVRKRGEPHRRTTHPRSCEQTRNSRGQCPALCCVSGKGAKDPEESARAGGRGGCDRGGHRVAI